MTRRQRLRTRPRLTAPGTVTNYEMAQLREPNADGGWPEGCWVAIWSSCSHAFHPRSQAEWDTHQGDDHGHHQCD